MRSLTRPCYRDRADRIRVASVADIDAMYRVRLAVRENVLRDPRRATYAHYVRYLGCDGRGWVSETDGQVVGFGIADRCSRSIWALFVMPEFQGCGIGRELLNAMTTWLFGLERGPIRLTTAAGTRAERFYMTAGWRAIDWPGSAELVFELRSSDEN